MARTHAENRSMNPYAILGVLLSWGILGSWATLETGRADEWKGKYDSLVASYKVSAQQAKDDAAKQEAADLKAIQAQSSLSIAQALSGKQKAESQLALYLQKGNAASGSKDLGHACFSVQIPAEDIP